MRTMAKEPLTLSPSIASIYMPDTDPLGTLVARDLLHADPAVIQAFAEKHWHWKWAATEAARILYHSYGKRCLVGLSLLAIYPRPNLDICQVTYEVDVRRRKGDFTFCDEDEASSLAAVMLAIGNGHRLAAMIANEIELRET